MAFYGNSIAHVIFMFDASPYLVSHIMFGLKPHLIQVSRKILFVEANCRSGNGFREYYFGEIGGE